MAHAGKQTKFERSKNWISTNWYQQNLKNVLDQKPS